MTTIEFTAEDFRQYHYCPRIIYFRYVLRFQTDTTYKMKKGQEFHNEKIRRKTQSRNEGVIISYNKFLIDNELGLAALFDAIAEENGEYYPIEYKTGKKYSTPPYHHLIQLLVQTVILDYYYKTNVRKAEIRYGPEDRMVIPITLQEKIAVLKTQAEMLKLVVEEKIPDPTPHLGKCKDCEYWRCCKRA